jgi:hypothetical protein
MLPGTAIRHDKWRRLTEEMPAKVALKECFKCKEPVFEIEGFLNQWDKPIQYNDKGGEEEHWQFCAVRRVEYEMKLKAQGKEIPPKKISQYPPETRTLDTTPIQQQTTPIQQDFNRSQSEISNSSNKGQEDNYRQIILDMYRKIENIENKIGDISNSIETIADQAGISLQNREPKPIQ